MKKFILAAASALLLMTSCTKEGTALFKGNYSFKTSGTVTADYTIVTVEEDGTESTSEGTADFDLAMEQGQMDILPAGGDDMIITMNILGGEVYTVDAGVSDNVITVGPFSRKVEVELTDLEKVSVPVTVYGEGRRYEKTVIFDLTLAGSYSAVIGDTSIDLVIVDSSVQCVSKLND